MAASPSVIRYRFRFISNSSLHNRTHEQLLQVASGGCLGCLVAQFVLAAPPTTTHVCLHQRVHVLEKSNLAKPFSWLIPLSQTTQNARLVKLPASGCPIIEPMMVVSTSGLEELKGRKFTEWVNQHEL
jgi:hypothetical protein